MSKEKIKYCNTLKINTRKIYNTIKNVYCPVLETKIIFNSVGFHHLIYKPDGTSRKISEVIYKLKLFPLAVPVIKNAMGISEERNVKVRISRKNKSRFKKGKAYSLVAKVGKKNPVSVRVIILRVGNGKFIFYSIMKD